MAKLMIEINGMKGGMETERGNEQCDDLSHGCVRDPHWNPHQKELGKDL